MGVVALTVGALLLEGPALLDGAVEEDEVVVATASPSSGTVPAVDVGKGVVHPLGGGTTVDDDLGYVSHFGVVRLVSFRR